MKHYGEAHIELESVKDAARGADIPVENYKGEYELRAMTDACTDALAILQDLPEEQFGNKDKWITCDMVRRAGDEMGKVHTEARMNL